MLGLSKAVGLGLEAEGFGKATGVMGAAAGTTVSAGLWAWAVAEREGAKEVPAAFGFLGPPTDKTAKNAVAAVKAKTAAYRRVRQRDPEGVALVGKGPP